MTFAQSGEEGLLIRLTEITEANLTNMQFGVSDLAREMGMSRSNLHRKVKSAAGTSISQFISQVKLKKAMELLKQSSLPISEIAFDSGFHSVTYFIKCFRDFYGYPPGQVRMNELEGNNSDDRQGRDARMGIGKKRVSLTFLISVIFVFIAAMVLVTIFKPFASLDKSLDPSIAVLPFINDSPEETEMYFINGTMEAILNNLGKVEDLRVVSRTSVEQYRDNSKPIPVVAEEMDVSYILEGSGHRDGDSVRLVVQLLDGRKDQHLWSNTYQGNIEDIFSMLSEIAQEVAVEIEAIITPEEKQLIEKIPTTSQSAYEFYLRAREEHNKSDWDNYNSESVEKAEYLYRYALKEDSTFAQVYVELGWIHWEKRPAMLLVTEYAIDTMLKLADIAISFDDQCASAYRLKAYYYRQIGMEDQAITELDKAIKLNPNHSSAYFSKAMMYWNVEPLLAIENFYISVTLDRGTGLASSLRTLSSVFNRAGFNEKAQYYNQEALELDSDSMEYFLQISWNEFFRGNFEAAIEAGLRGYALNSKNPRILFILGISYLYLEQFDTSLSYYKEFIEIERDVRGMIFYISGTIGYCFFMNGNEAEADHYLDEQIKYCEKMIEGNRESRKIDGYYNLAAVSAFRGDKVQAYENLRILNQWPKFPLWIVTYIKNDPLLDDLRDEPEFQQIVRDVEAKYQAEHEKVRQWLEENDML